MFHYDSASNDLKVMSSIESNQSCLLKVVGYFWKGCVGLISGGTQGTIAFWRPPFTASPSRQHRVHSLGVNAMDLFVTGDNLILATGGDDSNITLTVFALSQTKNESNIFSITEHIHTCQVSGESY